jgi:hypothetical protein
LTRRSGGVDWASAVEFGEAAMAEVGCGRRVQPAEALGVLIRLRRVQNRVEAAVEDLALRRGFSDGVHGGVSSLVPTVGMGG